LKLQVESLSVIIKFEQDDQSGRFSTRADGKTLTVTIYNSANVLGDGHLDPIKCGTLNGRPWFLSWWVWTVNKESNLRIFSYCILIEREVQGE
jgi:hypothetical protein